MNVIFIIKIPSNTDIFIWQVFSRNDLSLYILMKYNKSLVMTICISIRGQAPDERAIKTTSFLISLEDMFWMRI